MCILNSKKKWITWTVVILIVTNILTFTGATYFTTFLPNGKVLMNRSTYEEILKFQKLFEMRNILYRYYDGEIKDDVLVEGSIKGMAESLNDPYTVFMNKSEYEKFSEKTEGTYAGIGLQIEPKDNKINVVAVFDNTPAQKAGVRANDVIVKVNGTEVSGKDSTKAVTLMRGPVDTEVTVTFYREGKGLFDLKLKRAKINNITVTGEMLDSDVGYIQVDMFDEHVSKDFESKLKELKSKGMKSLVLDLRENPGGDLSECIKFTSNFLAKDKKIVSTIDKYKREKVYNSQGGNFIGLPLTVLIDENSASASEIFVGAVRDYKLGTLVGKNTFGKGVVQTILETGEGTALKVTISKYYTPSGENIHKIGIKPDVEVEYPEELRKKPYSRAEDPQLKKAIEIAKQKISK